MSKDKLDLAISALEKKFGKGLVTKLNSKEKKKMPVISTGSISLDTALGVGGIPKGRIIEIYGREASGKTSLALNIVAEVQKNKGKVVYVDSEHAFDPSWAKKIGVNIDELIFSQPDYAEQALEVVEEFVKSESVDLIVIDSVASLCPKAEIDGSAGDSHMGLTARLMSQAMRRLAGLVQKTNTTVIFINQVRMKIGVMFGSPFTTTGGNALKFYSTIRMDLARIKTIKKGDESLANEVRVKIVKNKVAPPYKQAIIEIYFDEGISRISDVIKLAEDFKIIKKKGSWYSYNDENIAQGTEQLRNKLKEDSKLLEELRLEVFKCLEDEDE